jgi:hypothetical protein
MNSFKQIEFYFFLLELVLCFKIGGFIMAGFIDKHLNSNKKLSIFSLLILGAGISPFIIGTLLYYLFWLLPLQSDNFYLLAVAIFYFIILISSYQSFLNLIIQFKNFVITFFKSQKLLTTLLFAIAIFLFVGWSYYIRTKLLTEHDTLEYAVQGKTFYEDKFIEYEKFRFDEKNGFFYVGLHGFSFPLLATFERMTNQFFGYEKDYFFRSLNSIFGILILMSVLIYSSEKKNLLFGIFICVALMGTYGFFETIMKYHIDHYRIFYLMCSAFLMNRLFENFNTKNLILFSIFLGAQANAHSLGFMLAIIQLTTVFLFLEGSFVHRFKNTFYIFALMIVFGASHYLVDIFAGTGWIFQGVKFY